MSNRNYKRGPKKFFMEKGFKDIQKKWYDKLKKEGFKDLEWVDHSTGFGQDSDYLKKNWLTDLEAIQKSCQLLRILGLFINSQDFFVQFPVRKHKTYYFLAENYINGATYRGLTKLVNKSRHSKRTTRKLYNTYNSKPPSYNLSEVYYIMQDIIKKALAWYEESDIDE